MITKKLKLMLLPLVALASFASCAWEKEYDGPKTDNKEVVFSMRVPANHTVTRALTEADEYEVKTLDVLVFKNSDGTLLSRSTHFGTPDVKGRNIDFYVKLEKDDNVTNYDFILLANVRDLITTKLYTSGMLNTGMSKDAVQAALKESLTAGTGWDTDASGTNASYKAMPMWGELNNQTIEAGKIYPQTTMLRSTVKIDLEVDLGSSGNTFELEEVWYYNYNTEGFVIPLAANLENGKAKTPTISGLTLNTANPIDYTDAISTDKQSLTYAIYGFEGPQGSLLDLANNPLLLIKGSFNGTSGWYRFDFANIDPATFTATYLPLLRNHWYKMQITAVNGPGYGDKDAALNSKPGNLGTNITIWDGENVLGMWNGNYEIKFNTLDAHFTQFATPTPQVITINTNVPELTFENFTNITKGSGDGEWAESPAGTWTNNHFSVVVAKGAPVGEYTDYRLTVTSNPTVSPDPARDSRFKVKGKNMEANIRITQDPHVIWRLITDPDPMNPIMIDGASQRIRVDVTSTHNYSVLLNNSGAAMFTAIYDVPTGGTPIPTTDISKDKTTIYIQADAYSAVNPRVSTFVIKHTELSSEASPATFNVLQVTPMITAILNEGGYTTELPQGGGNVVIKVESNMNAWVPVLKVKVGANAETTLTGDTDLEGYFGISTGTGKSDVTFTAPAISGDDDLVYTINFKDANGITITTPNIVITQKSKLLGGGGGGIPPTGGVRGEENILCVNSNGQLNLDGDGWIVYFKWGSTIATAGDSKTPAFTKDKVAWTPEGYDYDALMTEIGTSTAATAWGKIPYQSSGTEMIDNPTAGNGDPCKLAVKNGVVGGYKMPAGNPYNGYTTMGAWTTVNGIGGRYNTDQTQFYPAAGFYQALGNFEDVNAFAYYCTSTPYNTTYPYSLELAKTKLDTRKINDRQTGYTVRCIQK